MDNDTKAITELTLDIEELTLGQVEFLADYAGLDIDELQHAFSQQQLTLKLMIAAIALAANADDPESALPYARSVKIKELAGLSLVGVPTE